MSKYVGVDIDKCFHEFNLSKKSVEELRKGMEQGEGVRDGFLCSVSSLFEVQ